jgi:hypothetical protein
MGRLTKLVSGLIVASLLMAATAARAVPALQLDIIGGTYDPITQTVISSGPSFTLLALATATGNTSAADILADTYYISASLSPVQQSGTFDAGSFSIDGNVTQATDTGMIYGTPPLDAAFNSDLPGHGIYPTYYNEIALQFDANDTTTTYNSQDDTGGVVFDENGYGTFFVKLEVNVGGLIGKSLHFDLYNTDVRNNGSTFVDAFAPFSHDAQSLLNLVVDDDGGGETPVPEPSSSLILIAGLGLCWVVRRRQAAAARILVTTDAAAA